MLLIVCSKILGNPILGVLTWLSYKIADNLDGLKVVKSRSKICPPCWISTPEVASAIVGTDF